jgi:hypothetical protein
MTTQRLFPQVRLNQPWDLQARAILNNAVAGKLNVAGEVTLDPNVVATVLSDPIITKGSFIGLMPMTANAAAAIASIHFSPSATGSVVITHAINAQTDRIFRYAILG